MSGLSNWTTATVAAVGLVVGVGLGLPGLRKIVQHFSSLDSSPRTLLLSYELVLAALGACLALLVGGLVGASSPGLFSLGKLTASVSPVPLLGLGTRPGVTWQSELVTFAPVVTAVTAAFVYLGVRAHFSTQQAYTLLPWILLFAALNAAGEEWIYRVALLRATTGVLDLNAASLVSGAVFGVAHFWGMPGGVWGCFAAALLGFILCRVTVETGGIATAWSLHFVQDVVIFAGMLGATQPGASSAG